MLGYGSVYRMVWVIVEKNGVYNVSGFMVSINVGL